MDILVFALVVLLIVGLCIYLADLVLMDARFRLAAKVVLIVIAILLLANRAGLL